MPETASPAPVPAPTRTWLRLAGALALAAAATLALVHPRSRELVGDALEATRSLGPWRAAPIVAALYVPACVLFLPGSLVTLGAGVLGPAAGTVAVSLGSTTGACVAFLLGRTLARPWVEARVAQVPRWRAIDAAVARDGLKIVLLLRLSPVFPFNLLNYALGLTDVRLRDYALASFFGMLPGTVVFVLAGSAIGSVASLVHPDASGGEASPAQLALLAVGLVATIAAAVVIARSARRAIESASQPPAPATGAGTS